MKLLPNQMKELKTVSIGDIIIIVLVVLSMIFIVVSRETSRDIGTRYEIFRNQTQIRNADLVNDTFTIYSGDFDSSIIAVTDSSVEILYSSCRSKICVHTGVIHRSGEEIVCLPFKLICKISGKSQSDADIIAR